MRGFIFIWWSCGPLFPEWIIPICRCWALFIFSAVAESIRSILHTIFKIIQDRQHNSHSIRIQMTADGGTTHSKTNTVLGLAQSWPPCHAHTGCAFSENKPAGDSLPLLGMESLFCKVMVWKICTLQTVEQGGHEGYSVPRLSLCLLVHIHMSIIKMMCRVYQSCL